MPWALMFRISELINLGIKCALQVDTPFGWCDVYTIEDYPTLKQAVADLQKNEVLLQIVDNNGNKLEASF